MASNTPVSTLSAALTLDVAGFAAGVRQAESLSRRLAKAQADALGGPALRRAGGDALSQQVIRAQELRARALADPNQQGPVRLRQGNIDAEISAEMAKRVSAAQRRVDIERQAAETISAIRTQSAESVAAEESRLANQVADLREESMRRAALRESAYLATQETARAQASQEIRRNAEQEAQHYRTAGQMAEDRWDREIHMISRARAASTALFSQLTGARGSGLPSASNSAFNDLPENFDKLKPKAAAAEYALRSIGNTSADSQKKMRDFNLRILQGGYQLQDFVVQVGSGTNALVAFAQQGSQMAGFFGTAGAWVGVALAVAALGTNLLMMRNRTKEVGAEAKKVADTYKEIRDFNIEILRAQSGNIEIFDFASAREREVKASKELLKNQKDLLQIENILDKLAPRKRFSGTRDMPVIPTKIQNPFPRVPFGDMRDLDTGQLLEQEKTLRKANVDLTHAQAKASRDVALLEAQIFETLKKNRTTVIEALYPNRKPPVDEKMLSDLVKRGAIIQKEADAYRTMAQIQKLRSESDILAGKTNAEQVQILQKQIALIYKLGLIRSEVGVEVQKQLADVQRAAKLEARGYLDQLSPLRAKRRELENIKKLQSEGFLPEGTANKFLARYIDEARRGLKIPDVLTMSGATSSGGFVGNSTASTLLESTRKMLSALEKIVSNTALMAGTN